MVANNPENNRNIPVRNNYLCGAALTAALFAFTSLAQQSNTYDLSQASLEDLMNIQVTSVSKKEQKFSKAGAAVFVITQEDIRRSGATNIPDVLRLAPGVDVARVDANRWAISIRGFNDQHANKVLVLIDGRSVYSPSFSGVFWDMVDVPLEDIERIEVIRGPGGTVWGANAVNGVINIITMNSSATVGGLVTAGGGSEDRADTLVQYGSQVGTNGSYRIFGRFFDIGNSEFPNGQPAGDAWFSGHAGFRSDWTFSAEDNFMLQGDFAKTSESQNVTAVIGNQLPLTETFDDSLRTTDVDMLARWNHTLANGSQMSLQVYDYHSRHLDVGFHDEQNTVDVDFQHRISLLARNDVVWGLGTRVIDSNYGRGYDLTILPGHRLDPLFSSFVQDEIKLANSLSLTIGTKLEHNVFTGFEFQPSAQIVWIPADKQTWWASVSRALREPSAVDAGLQNQLAVTPGGPTFTVIETMGNPYLKPEELRDVEAGYRAMPNRRLSLDIAAFRGNYRNSETVTSETPYLAEQNGLPYMVLPFHFTNLGSVRTYGGEFFANWSTTGHWRISPGYAYLRIDALSDAAAMNPPAGTSPNHQFQLKSLLDLPHHLEWDNTLSYVDKLAVGNIPAYLRLDSRLGWRSGELVEWGIVGQNLLSPRHGEFYEAVYPVNYTLVERSVFGKATLRF